eukprot:TRINITY_DN2380_c1_g1_i1.p1 TRINITY_DN2380_c1_g1~~TRINITY_DN2380_c1_g1_i1.p1  ORF type:complete len:357 (+),score=54.62 TRINITY_DN2380_c1_g1_i1:63-1133(+)
MNIFVSMSDDPRREVISVDVGDSLQEIERKAAEEFGFDVGSFELTFSGEPLEDVSMLSGGNELVLHYSKKFFAIRELQQLGISPPYVPTNAIRSDNLRLLELILDTGAEIGFSLVSSAVNHSLPCLKLLLTKIDKNLAFDFSTRAIPLTSKEATVLELLNFGADPTALDRKTGGNGLHHIAAFDDDPLSLAELLVNKYDFDVSIQDKRGMSAVHYSAGAGNIAILRFLLSKGADPSPCSSVGLQPIHFAASRGRLECLRELCQQGADSNSRNNAGNTPLFFAVRNGKPRIIEYLATVGANPNIRNEVGISAYMEVEKDKVQKDRMESLFGKEFPPEKHPTPFSTEPQKNNCKCVIM